MLLFAFCNLLTLSVAYIFVFCLLLILFSLRIVPLCVQAGCHRRQLNLGYNLSQFIICYSFLMFDDLYSIDLVVIGLVLCLLCCYAFFSCL